jgi:DNA-binding transcriptional MerR regulator
MCGPMKARRLIFRTFPLGQRSHLTVGEAASHLQSLGYQASTSLIRKLEREGLIESPDRSAGNYRLIDQQSLMRLRRVLGLRALGLSVEETRDILAVLDRSSDTSRSERGRLLDDLDTQIRLRQKQLDDLRVALRERRRP